MKIEIKKLTITEAKSVIGGGLPGGTSGGPDDYCSCCCAEDPGGTSGSSDTPGTCCCVCTPMP